MLSIAQVRQAAGGHGVPGPEARAFAMLVKVHAEGEWGGRPTTPSARAAASWARGEEEEDDDEASSARAKEAAAEGDADRPAASPAAPWTAGWPP